MRNYPEYIDSGIEWIGEIPRNWNMVKIKHIVALVTEKSMPESDAIKISPENVESKTGKILDLSSAYDSVGVKFQAGDVLFNKLRVYLSKVVFAEWSGYSLSEMIVLRPSVQDTGKYLFYLMLSCRFIEYCNSVSYGVKMPRTSVDDILNAKVSLPSVSEQTQIANFLDRKTTQIDKLIRAKERKIELLGEYRASLINQAVTKGLDPNAEMNRRGWSGFPSCKGLEGLKVKHVSSSNPTKNNPNTQSFKDEPVVFLPMERVHTDGTIDQALKLPFSQLKTGYTYFEKNDVLVAKVTPCLRMERSSLLKIWQHQLDSVSTEFIVIRPNVKKCYRFFYIICFTTIHFVASANTL